MSDWEMRKQVKKFVEGSLARSPDLFKMIKEFGECCVDHRDRLRIVEIDPPVVVGGKTIRYALYDGESLQGCADDLETAEAFCTEDDE
jgi:hypothetical protein